MESESDEEFSHLMASVSPSAMLKRRNSVRKSIDRWQITDLPIDLENEGGVGPNAKKSKLGGAAATGAPAKVCERRRSVRIMEKNKQHSASDSNNTKPIHAASNETIDLNAASNSNENEDQMLYIDHTHLTARTKQSNGLNGLNAKCDLSVYIAAKFTDIIQDKNHMNRFSAKCTICDDEEPRKHFVRGNNSNLKSHLQRVSAQSALPF